MDKIEKIRQVIEQLRREVDDHNYYLDNSEQAVGYANALDDIEKFLNTLSEEPDKSLEEAALSYVKNKYNFSSELVYNNIGTDDFKAGAEWQKSQMLKDAVEGEICGRVYDHINVRFADGVCKYLEPKNISHIPADVSKYNIGDKVRILVLKAEEE